MLFIFIPLGLILVSFLGIVIIVWRKIPYLKKLTVQETNEDLNYDSGWRGFLADFLPELNQEKIQGKAQGLKDLWLLELEKLIRKLRLLSLKADRLSDSLIKKIRRVNNQAIIAQTGSQTPEPAIIVKEESTIVPSVAPRETRSIEALRHEEQRLIIEIAKDPKNSRLYEVLGDLYIEMRNFTDAKDSFEAGIELDPENEELKQKLSSALESIHSTAS